MSHTTLDIADIGTTREVLQTEPPRGARNFILVAAALIVAAMSLSLVLPVEAAETLAGTIAATNPVRTITAPATASIISVAANNGQVVNTGDPLVTLDTTTETSQLALVTSQLDTIAGQLANYAALRQAVDGSGNPFTADGPDARFYLLLEQHRAEVAQAQTNQATTSQTAQASLTTNQTTLANLGARQDELRRLTAAVRAGTDYSSADGYAQSLYDSFVAGQTAAINGTDTALASQYGADFIVQVESQITDLDSQRAALTAEVQNLQAQVQQAKTADSDLAATLRTQFLVTLLNQEEELRNSQSSLGLDATKLKLAIGNAQLTAPCDGIVDIATPINPGDLVATGQALLTIVPTVTTHQVEAAVPANLVPVITPGQTVNCSLPATTTTRKTELTCAVDTISTTYQTTEDGTPYYIAELTIQTDETPLQLNSGAQVRVDVITRRISALRWLGEAMGLVSQG
ncbi:MAG: HlyD family secretion protein [Propionibacteriaceae bacterium]|jgi:HlyD family secretion protein|nr:HlyD family secretion protein [Propionibacteriaceae bacterium]